MLYVEGLFCKCIIFKNAEIFKYYFFQIKKYCEAKIVNILKIFPFVEMNVSKLN